MKVRSLQRTAASAIALSVGMAASVFLPQLEPFLASVSAAPSAETAFPDTEDYWGQPFIQALAERNIVTGYPDNTYRPERSVDRDEFAAILRQAFAQDVERQLSSGSVYNDIPEGYWAAPAIEEAYQMGFMKGYPGGEFRPNQSVTRTEVLVSLAQNLDLSTPTSETPNAQASAAASTTAPQQTANRRRVQSPLMFPLAMTALMPPMVASPRATSAANVPSTNETQSSSAPPPVSFVVSDYYVDAAEIPQYAVDDVARATEAGIVVNHPNPSVLDPTAAATRGEVAALIHQALVHQERISPLPIEETATNYIVNR